MKKYIQYIALSVFVCINYQVSAQVDFYSLDTLQSYFANDTTIAKIDSKITLFTELVEVKQHKLEYFDSTGRIRELNFTYMQEKVVDRYNYLYTNFHELDTIIHTYRRVDSVLHTDTIAVVALGTYLTTYRFIMDSALNRRVKVYRDMKGSPVKIQIFSGNAVLLSTRYADYNYEKNRVVYYSGKKKLFARKYVIDQEEEIIRKSDKIIRNEQGDIVAYKIGRKKFGFNYAYSKKNNWVYKSFVKMEGDEVVEFKRITRSIYYR